jgi:RHS repeat-associated protein
LAADYDEVMSGPTLYMQQRYYEPLAGRFLSVDPVTTDAKTGGHFNRYDYANNNPYRFKDPDGRSPLDVGFLAYDVVKFGVAVYSGVGIGAAAADVAISMVGMVSPIPGTGQGLKMLRGAEKIAETAKAAEKVAEGGSKIFSKEKQALVDMAKGDKKSGMTSSDMKAYKDLNKQLPDPFPTNKVRGPEAHSSGAPSSHAPHGHVGPVDHIPIKDPVK